MWSMAWRTGGASLISALLLATFTVSAAAHDESCQLDLRQAPIESVQPPSGWVWRQVAVGPDGWRGSLEWSGGDLRTASFAISCVVDPAGLFERRVEVRRSAGDEEIELEAVIGDETAGWRSSRTATTHIEWRGGGAIGEIIGEWNASVAELAAMASALETTRSGGEALEAQVDQ